MCAVNADVFLDRHIDFWKRASAKTPLLSFQPNGSELPAGVPLGSTSIPLADGSRLMDLDRPLTAGELEPRLLVADAPIPQGTGRLWEGGPRLSGDLLVTRAALGKFPWVEAVLGCPVVPKLSIGSIWSQPYLNGPEELSRIPRPEDSPWLDVIVEYTRALIADSDGEAQVVQCLQRGPIDLACALLGSTPLCYAIYDQSRELRALTEYCTEVFLTVARAQQKLAPRLEGGLCTPFGVWAPGTVVRTQCDTAAMVSPATYESFFLPFDIAICECFDYSIMHLHSGYLDHTDVLLPGRHPMAIQISLDTGSTPTTVNDLLPLFRRVLEAKPLLISGSMTTEEFTRLRDELPSEGLYIAPTAVEDE